MIRREEKIAVALTLFAGFFLGVLAAPLVQQACAWIDGMGGAR